MKQILLFGAGKSATVLIDYLLEHAGTELWNLLVVDTDIELARSKINGSAYGEAASFDVTDHDERSAAILAANLVISMLPPALHELVASSCLEHGRHLLTASYVDHHMRSLDQAIREKNIIFLCEMGLDPGIDHMSAMKMIDEIHAQEGRITSFHSHCGGLIAPESDDNPWHYKISWNPRNIVMAGSSGAVYKKDGQVVTVPYSTLFQNEATVTIKGLDPFAWYANRDSLSYLPLYGLQETASFLRTTLRHPHFMKAWKYVVQAGLTSELPFEKSTTGITFNTWLDTTILANTGYNDLESMLLSAGTGEQSLVKGLFTWLGLNGNDLIPSAALCAADVLQSVLEKKLRLKPDDKDMIVMLHELTYRIGEQDHAVRSSLVVKGSDAVHTAMAKTVGLPLGIAARLILNNSIRLRGLQIPVHPGIYQPVLAELSNYGIRFHEEAVLPVPQHPM